MSSGTKQTISVSLPNEMIAWLDKEVNSQSLSSRSKAVRCCMNCVALDDVKMVITNEDYTSSKYQALDIELGSEQIDWLHKFTSKDFSQSKVIHSVVEACMKADESVVFRVIRCKLKVAECGGAQEVVDLLSKRYGENNVEIKEEIKLL